MKFISTIVAVIVGGCLTMLGQYLSYRWQTERERSRDKKRKALLSSMLDNPGPDGWRKLTTMAHVIGATEEETARLLVELDARASETGSGSWAFIKDKPLPDAR